MWCSPFKTGRDRDNAFGGTHLQLRGLQSERPMRTLLVVILDKFCQYGPKMLLVQDDDVVKALSAQGPDHSFRDGIRHWRVDRSGDSVDADALGALSEVAAIDGIPIVEQMAWFLAPRRGRDDLPPHPGCGRL